MNRLSRSPENIVHMLQNADILTQAGTPVWQVRRRLDIKKSTFYRWKKRFNHMSASHAARTVALEREVACLRKRCRRLSSQLRETQAAVVAATTSHSQRRHLVCDLQRYHGISQRAACRAACQPRATQRYQTRAVPRKQQLTRRVLELAGEHPRYGYRRITELLNNEGWHVGPRRIYRIFRTERLQVRPIRRSKRRTTGWMPLHRRIARSPNEIWAWDLTCTEDLLGGRLVWLSLIDEFTRECLALKAMRRFRPTDLVATITAVVHNRSAPRYLRSDNEFSEHRWLRRWLLKTGMLPLYIAPGSPWQNCYIESFHSRLRDELILSNDFETLEDAKQAADWWCNHYNYHRRHSGLNDMTPAQFAESLTGAAA